MKPNESNFGFLQPHEPQLFRLGTLAERYFSEDPNTCNIKLRQFSELVAQFTAIRLGLSVAQSDNLADLLRLLKIECNLPKQVLEILHSLRIAGNQAAHQNTDDHLSALSGLKLARQLAIWYFRTFHKPSGGFGPFIPPKRPKDVSDSIVLELERLKAELEASLTEADRLREAARQAEIERQSAADRAEQERVDRETWEKLAEEAEEDRRALSSQLQSLQLQASSIRALNMAIALRSPQRWCIFHSDRGSQYCSHDYQKILREHGFKVSMSGKGNCYDNAAVETFFKTIKAELIWRRPWETRRQAETAIFQYINGFYNPRRRHSALGGKSPLAFERQVA